MAQYLMAMIGNNDRAGMLFGMPENGRMGDYVFNQEGKSTLCWSSLQFSGNLKHSPGSDNDANNGEFEC